MKVEKREGSIERQIVTAMIVDGNVLSRIAAQWQKGLFRTGWVEMVARWCVLHFEKYGKAPEQKIRTLFDAWAIRQTDQTTVQLVEKFLLGLSEDWASAKSAVNPDFVVDQAATQFNRVRLERLRDDLESDLTNGDEARALERVVKYNRVELGAGSGVHVLGDVVSIEQAFEHKREPLVTYRGALGRFFGSALERDGFVAFMGPEKRGKTWWLIDVAYRAVTVDRRRVAFFEVGDMSQHQIMRRFMCRVSRQPLRSRDYQYPKSITLSEQGNESIVELETRAGKALTSKQAVEACAKLMENRLATRDPLLRLSVHPNSSLSVAGMRNVLDGWERQSGWTPDVVVVDYADILAAPAGFTGENVREGVNTTWKQLRALSQERHCLVVTATQANAQSYNASLLDMANFSEDKRKYAHVTGMVGLNCTATEKQRGVMRLNWLALREDESSPTHCVHVAGCLALGNPAVCSTYREAAG